MDLKSYNKTMLDAVKKTILAGIGATVTTKEKAEVVLKELVDKGNITAKEARVMGNKIARGSKKEFEESKKKLEKHYKDALSTLSKAKVVSNAEHVALEKRVRLLEAKLDGKKTGKKAARKKKVISKKKTSKKKTKKKK